MSLNRFMHPRSPYYNNSPDFSKLIDFYPDLKSYLHYECKKTKCTIDFHNPNALKALCCALLKQSFDLEIDIPIDHIIPRVPLRVNYCLWIEDLLGKKENAYGIDIGCGSSCIYSLILCKLNKSWKMLCSDIDDSNIDYADKNVNLNKMGTKIKVKKVDKNVLIKGLIDPEIDYDFTMTNPPFFEDHLEAQGIKNTRKPADRSNPRSINTAKDFECIYDEGGEVGFVQKIIDESEVIGKKIRIYTSMLGKKKSFFELKKYLTQTKGINNISEARFCQGNTIRWALASYEYFTMVDNCVNDDGQNVLMWSFHEEKLPKIDYMKADEKNEPLVYKISKSIFNDNYNIEYIFNYLKSILLHDLKVNILNDKNHRILFIACENTWSHQRRKRRMELQTNKEELKIIESLDNSSESNKRKLEIDDVKNGKKLKTDQICEYPEEKNYLIKCEIGFNHLNDFICLEMNYKDGVSKESMHQILQFIRNKLEKVNS